MDEVRFDGLLEREKQVLRLLWEGHDAKGVARTLDLSTNVVNERLRDVRRKLGVPSSREAARLLAWHEGTAPKSVGNNPFGIETDVSSAPPLALPDEQAKETAEAPAHRVREEQATFEASNFPKPVKRMFPLRRTGETGNDLSRKERFDAIVDLATKLVAALALACLVAILMSAIIRRL